MKVQPIKQNPSEFTVGRTFRNAKQLREWIQNPNAFYKGQLDIRAGVFAK